MNACICTCTSHCARIRPPVTSPRGARLRATAVALALAGAAMPWGAHADVQSLSVTPVDVASGGTATGTVKLDTTSLLAQTVALESSNAALASVPASVQVGPAGASFAIGTAAGQAGCSTLSAKQSKTSAVRRTVLFVAPAVSPEAPVRLGLSKGSVAGGASLTGTVSVLVEPAIGGVVQRVSLASSNPSVTVPASATLTPGRDVPLQASFSIATSVVGSTGCSVISATYNGVTTRALLKLFSISG